VRCTTLLVLSFAACTLAPVPGASNELRTPSGTLVAVLRNPVHDPAQHADTCKCWHAVHAADGRLLTKDLGGEYPHHRGLFLGWNKMRWNGRDFDFWHCRNGETQQFRGFLPSAASDGCQPAQIDWCVSDGTRIVAETRSLRARDLGEGEVAIDIECTLSATAGDVVLDGDPQHAGHQFRALQQFAEKGATPVRYVRPAGAKGADNDVWTDCRWIAAVLPLAGGDVTVLRIEGSGNPGPTQWSTRGYGRFGATFSTVLRPAAPLSLRWTYVVATGERDGAWCERTAAACTGKAAD
jgi:hypothetical protein